MITSEGTKEKSPILLLQICNIGKLIIRKYCL